MDITNTNLTLKYSTIENAIKSFGIAPAVSELYPVVSSDAKVKQDLLLAGIQCGYLFLEDVMTQHLQRFLLNAARNHNSTFFKTWEEISQMSEREFRLNQILHYMSTYGTDFEGEAYIPNDNPVLVAYNQFTTIKAATIEEFYEKVMNLLSSGIALSEETLDMCVDVINVYRNTTHNAVDLTQVKNKDARIRLYSILNIRTMSPTDMMRLLVYKATSSTLVIKNPETIHKIKSSGLQLSDYLTNQTELEKFSTVFNRYKELILAFKHNDYGKENSVIVNKLRRLAKKFHTPMKRGLFESITDPNIFDEYSVESVIEILQNERNIFKIIRAISALKEKMMTVDADYAKSFIIRNGKVFTRQYKKQSNVVKQSSYEVLFKELFFALNIRLTVQLLYTNKRTVYLPENLDLACPVSEKQFMGNIPYGSSYTLGENNYFGVYWRNEWGTRDFDLSFCGKSGERLGWNRNFRNSDNTVLFSGDMTDADPEATEMFYCKNTMPDGVIKLNRFSGLSGSTAEIFFGSDEIKKLSSNYMVDPNSIKLKEKIVSVDKEQTIACVADGKAYFTALTSGDQMVSNNSVELFNGLKRKLYSYMSFKEVLALSGYLFVDSPEDADYDFSVLNKDTLIKFFNDAAETYDSFVKFSKQNKEEN